MNIFDSYAFPSISERKEKMDRTGKKAVFAFPINVWTYTFFMIIFWRLMGTLYDEEKEIIRPNLWNL